MAKRNKEQNLLNAAIVLVLSTIIVKIIGALYKIPLVWLIGTTGNGYFLAAYEVYTTIYTISMAGLPIAVSRLVSENIASGKYRQAQQVFKVAQKIFLIAGTVGTLLLLAVAYPYSKLLLKTSSNFVSILAIAPCVFFCCMMSSYRGYYEGTRNMYPTGISQIIEAAGKMALGLFFSYIMVQYGKSRLDAAAGSAFSFFGRTVTTEQEMYSVLYPYAAAAAILGVTVGSMVGMFYLIIKYKSTGGAFSREELINSPSPLSGRDTGKEIIRIAIPVAVNSMVLTISNFIDSFTVKNRLAHAMQVGADVINNQYAYSISADNVAASDIPTYLYGAYGLALNLKNLVPTLMMALGISVIPMLAAAWSQKDTKAVKNNVESVFRITMLIGLPAGFGMAALSEPILQLLYGSKDPGAVKIAAPILFVYALSMAVYAVSSPLTNMLNAINRMDAPIKAIIIGSLVKIVMNFVLVGNPEINVMAVPYSSLACYAILAILNIGVLLKETKIKINVVSVVLKPLIAAALCGGSAYLVYSIFTNRLSRGNTISVLASVCVGGIVYFAALLLVKGFAKEDVMMLPKGEKIAKVLEKFRLLG